MKKILALILSCTMFLSGCSLQGTVDTSLSEIVSETTAFIEPQTDEVEEITTESVTEAQTEELTLIPSDSDSAEYVETLGFNTLDDPELLRYVEDTVYSDLVYQLNSDEYFVENVQSIYISKEYLDELAYNSQSNIFFGYTLAELEAQFQGEKYVFTLSENGETTVQTLVEYDDTFDQVIKNVAIGTGVILVCVTVSVVTGGAGAHAVSMIFATSAKAGAIGGLTDGVISGVSAGVVTGIQTKDFDAALKSAALNGSEGFKWGAIVGTITGGVGESVALKGATLNGLTMNEAALIQKESKLPLDVISQFHSMEEYLVYKEAGLKAVMVNGQTALVQNIDLNYVSELPDGSKVTNLVRMQKGYAPIDPVTQKAYQLHHIGQKADGTLAVLTETQHQGNSAILNVTGKESEIVRSEFAKIRKEFWSYLGNQVFTKGGI